MTNLDSIKNGIILNQDFYFDTQSKWLEQRIAEIRLSDHEEEVIISSKTKKTIRDKALGLFKVGEIVNTLLNRNEEIDNEIKNAKKDLLLSLYFEKADQQENGIQQIKYLITNPRGNTLFNKITRILDNTPPDIELTKHLSNILYHISNSDFWKLFEDHKFVLWQIELLDPQVLSILADYKNRPTRDLLSYSSNWNKITSNWIPDFINEYIKSKHVTDPRMATKITHSMKELINRWYGKALINTEKEKTWIVIVTEIGKLIARYIE